MRQLALAVALLSVGSLQAADPQLLGLAMPDSQIMAGANVQPVLQSPLGQFVLMRMGLSASPLESLVDMTGFDPRRDLQEVLVSLKTGANKNTDGIVLGRGTFDVPKLLEVLQADGGTIDAYKGVSIVYQHNQQSIAFPNSTLAIFGDALQIKAAIDRLTAPATINPALLALAEKLSASEDAWVASVAPLSQFTGGQTGDNSAAYAKVLQVSGGVKFGANIVVTAETTSATEQDAAALAMMMKMAGVAFAKQPTDQQATAIAALLQSMNVTVDGNVTNLTLTIPETQLEQTIQRAEQAKPRAEAVPPLADTPVPQRIRVGGKVQAAKLTQKVDPVYPPLANQARISGVVRLNVIVGKDGTVENMTVESGHPLLVPAALEAVKQWVYKPTLLNGQPVEVVTQVEVPFEFHE